MIRQVRIKNFKRWREVTFDLPGQVVLAGPNNVGKTTLLQAIAAWSIGLNRWRELNRFKRFGKNRQYMKAPMQRADFTAVPLRTFDLLWHERASSLPIVIEVRGVDWRIGIEISRTSSEQIEVRPSADSDPERLKSLPVSPVFVPAMSGVTIDEPVYQTPKINQLLGMAKPGDVLRNLLVEARDNQPAWTALTESVAELFRCELLPPSSLGAHIVAEYRERPRGPTFDLASAGSGFQQVVMLFAVLHTRGKSVLLVDEPDAHLHMILQETVYARLRSVAAASGSQIIVATHAEAIIDRVDLQELCIVVGRRPRYLSGAKERAQLRSALKLVTQTEMLKALEAPGVLYTEDYSDLGILCEWARVLGHPALGTLTTDLFWKATGQGPSAKEHFGALRLVHDDLRGLELVDGDAADDKRDSPLTGSGLQRARWRRYEIESYLLHPDVLSRFVEHMVGGAAAARPGIEALRRTFADTFPPAVVRDPLGDHQYLVSTKARTKLIPPLLEAAGVHAFPHTRYAEIAAMMRPEEIHPEVREKLDAIQKAFGLDS